MLQPIESIVHVWHPLLLGGGKMELNLANTATMAPIKAEMNFPASGRRAMPMPGPPPQGPRVNAVSGTQGDHRGVFAQRSLPGQVQKCYPPRDQSCE